MSRNSGTCPPRYQQESMAYRSGLCKKRPAKKLGRITEIPKADHAKKKGKSALPGETPSATELRISAALRLSSFLSRGSCSTSNNLAQMENQKPAVDGQPRFSQGDLQSLLSQKSFSQAPRGKKLFMRSYFLL